MRNVNELRRGAHFALGESENRSGKRALGLRYIDVYADFLRVRPIPPELLPENIHLGSEWPPPTKGLLQNILIVHIRRTSMNQISTPDKNTIRGNNDHLKRQCTAYT